MWPCAETTHESRVDWRVSPDWNLCARLDDISSDRFVSGARFWSQTDAVIQPY